MVSEGKLSNVWDASEILFLLPFDFSPLFLTLKFQLYLDFSMVIRSHLVFTCESICSNKWFQFDPQRLLIGLLYFFQHPFNGCLLFAADVTSKYVCDKSNHRRERLCQHLLNMVNTASTAGEAHFRKKVLMKHSGVTHL